MATPRTLMCLLAALAALTLPARAQLATPPKSKPAPLSPDVAPTRPAPPRQPAKPSAPDVDYDPLARRDAEGKIIPLTLPVEYAALAQNPLIDVPTLTAIAPYFYDRRRRVERHVIDHVDILAQVESGIVESVRFNDESSLETLRNVLGPVHESMDLNVSFSSELAQDKALSPALAALNEKIMFEFTEAVYVDAQADESRGDGSTAVDRAAQAVVRMSLSELEYYYRRLLLEAADQFPGLRPTLEIPGDFAPDADALAAALSTEESLDVRAAAIREFLAKLPIETRRNILRAAIALRPEVDPSKLMGQLPAGATPKTLDPEMRREIVEQLVDGERVDTAALTQ